MNMSGYVYTCSAGETFDSIGREIYGDERHAAELLCANPEYTHMSVFVGGEILYLPVVTVAAERDKGLPVTPPWKEG